MIATRESPGTTSFSSSSLLALSSGEMLGEAGDIPAGPRQARDKACPDRIGAVGHYDRNGPSLLFDRRNRHIGGGHDHVHLQAHQLGGDLGYALGPAVAEPALDDDVLPFYIPALSQALR